MKKLLSLVCAAALTLSCLAGALPRAAAEAIPSSTGRTYYVSSKGVGGNDGLSEAKPLPGLNAVDWSGLQPGDKVLLEKGSVFEGSIHLVDVHGTAEAPITIGTYGTDSKRPVINGRGQGIWFQDYGQALDNGQHKYRGYVSSTILLYDCDFVEISGLEITNSVPYEEEAARFQPGEAQTLGAGIMDRTGVAGVAKNGGTMEHIYLKDLYIHDVNGNIQDKHMNNGGIQLNALKPDNENATGVARYDNVRITNCRVQNVSRAGICVGYTYQWARFQGADISDETARTYGHTNLHIANNYVKDAGNDAIVALYAYAPMVEYNISDHAGADLPMYNTDEQWQRFCAAIWPWKCKDAVFQYNEAFNTEGQNNGDGQAWDVDWSDGTVYQYNYSHNNGMGPILFCLEEATNGVFRYNLSVDDLGCYMTLQGNPNAKIYNNVFYTGAGKSVSILHADSGKNKGNAWIANNIFYSADPKEVSAADWTGAGGTKTYTNNLYYNFSTTPTDDTKAVKTDPLFAAPGNTPVATGGIISARAAFDGFKLATGSPAVNAGVLVSGNGGRDFFGNTLDNSPDIGIHDTGTPSSVLSLGSDVYTVDNTAHTITGLPGGLTVEDFVKDLIVEKNVTITVKDKGGNVITGAAPVDLKGSVELTADSATLVTYTFIADGDNALKSALFEVRDATISVPVTALTQTTVGELLAGVTAAQTAALTVTDSGIVQNASTVLAEGMKLIITAQSGEAREYTVRVKNVYNHSSDWLTPPNRGNVWSAQGKVDGIYADLTRHESGAGWNSWAGDGFAAVEHYSICGNIKADSENASTSMSFRAPASGLLQLGFDTSTYQVTFRKDPYNTTNNPGTVWLLITKNGETLPGRRYQLPKDNSALNIVPFTVAVEKGDMIRFEAQCLGAIADGGFSMVPVVTYLEEDPAGLPGIRSEVYAIDDSAKTITNVPWGTTVGAFKAALTAGANTVLGAVSNGATELGEDERMTENMTLILAVTVNDATLEYAITLNARKVTYTDYDRTGWSATAGSEQPATAPAEGPAVNVLDGKDNTIWHTNWNGCSQDQVWITIDMGAAQEIGRVSYLTRQSGGNNGKYRQYEIEVSADGKEWTTVASGTWGADDDYTEIQHATFTPVTAQYVRLVGVTTAHQVGSEDKIFGAAAEIYIGYPVYEQ